MKKRPRFILEQPIDFKALSEAFELSKWKWGIGFRRHFPDEKEVESSIKRMCEESKKCNGYCESGGFIVSCLNGVTEISIDLKIHAHLPAGTPGRFDSAQDAIAGERR